MLIDLHMLRKKWKLDMEGILHVGAHLAEEADVYAQCGVTNVVWVEGNPDLMGKLAARVRLFRGQNVLEALVSDTDDEEVTFHITRDPEGTAMSSSILELNLHKLHAPWVKEVEQKRIRTSTIDTLASVYAQIDSCNFINLDIQGAELLALRGAEKFLTHCDYVYTEVNTNYLYENCVLLPELDAFLADHGFVRVEIVMTDAEWGDAFYRRA